MNAWIERKAKDMYEFWASHAGDNRTWDDLIGDPESISVAKAWRELAWKAIEELWK